MCPPCAGLSSHTVLPPPTCPELELEQYLPVRRAVAFTVSRVDDLNFACHLFLFVACSKAAEDERIFVACSKAAEDERKIRSAEMIVRRDANRGACKARGATSRPRSEDEFVVIDLWRPSTQS